MRTNEQELNLTRLYFLNKTTRYSAPPKVGARYNQYGEKYVILEIKEKGNGWEVYGANVKDIRKLGK